MAHHRPRRTWQDVRPDAEKPLAFRDVEADSAQVAQVLAIGPRGQSRIYKTTDGGKTWTRTFKNAEAGAFYDCLAMFPDGMHGVAMSDPVDGKFRVISTQDAGDTWKIVNSKGMPRAKDGEFGFAASGTCIVTAGIKDAWIASGGAASRVFHSRDYGQTWKVAKTSIPSDPDGGGVFSLAFRAAKIGIAVGGNFLDEDNGRRMSARTGDGGDTWVRGGNLDGYRSGVSWCPTRRALSRSAPAAPRSATTAAARGRPSAAPASTQSSASATWSRCAGPAVPRAWSACWSGCQSAEPSER